MEILKTIQYYFILFIYNYKYKNIVLNWINIFALFSHIYLVAGFCTEQFPLEDRMLGSLDSFGMQQKGTIRIDRGNTIEFAIRYEINDQSFV